MTIIEYIAKVKSHLMTNPLVESFGIIRERTTPTDGHLRVKLRLSNGFVMEFSEYIQMDTDGNILVVTYSYHCTDLTGRSVVRWDNTPHFPDLPGFPHHKHIGPNEFAESGYPMNIFKVFIEIEGYV